MFRRVPFVYDIQDLWPDSLGSTGMFQSSYGFKVVASICRWVYKRASHITVQSQGVKDCLIARDVSDEKVSVIFNWCDESSIDTRPLGVKKENQETQESRSSFDVLFAGNMGKAQELDVVLEAAALLKTENPAIRLLLMGGGIEVPRLKQIVEDKLISNVTFLPRVPMSEVGRVFDRADALLVHLKDDPLFKITIPAKTQAYLAAGKPIIMAVAGDAAELVLESGAGVCAQPGNARSIADAILQLALTAPEGLRRMGEQGRSFYWKKMSLDVGAKKFASIFQRINDDNAFV
jgi:glycosyltransferase involved in cell wall biosynthesis